MRQIWRQIALETFHALFEQPQQLQCISSTGEMRAVLVQKELNNFWKSLLHNHKKRKLGRKLRSAISVSVVSKYALKSTFLNLFLFLVKTENDCCYKCRDKFKSDKTRDLWKKVLANLHKSLLLSATANMTQTVAWKNSDNTFTCKLCRHHNPWDH